MVKINKHYGNLKENYLFAEVSKRVAEYKEKHPGADVISLGIGDVTLPLAESVTGAIRRAADDMSKAETFYGYGPYEGYAFLRDVVAGYYGERGCSVGADEIFIGDGAKNDLGAILDLFGTGNTVLIPDPVYPAYVDANVMAGNTVRYIGGTEQNGFLPPPPDFAGDIVYLCSPNNPTGAVYDRAGLQAWVNYAQQYGAVILYDAAYECFISGGELPRSIFSVAGAENCAIEFCSFSKMAGFTGVRCGYTVIPKALTAGGENLHAMWTRRAAVKYNGTSYIVQRAAEAVFSPGGREQCRENIGYYLGNAEVIGKALRSAHIKYFGGSHSPYIWFRCPDGIKSWDMFDRLLAAGVVSTPGAGFGKNGEGYCRLTAFGDRDKIKLAMDRFLSVKLG